jgi:WASH complex subunit strumpellin
MIHLGLGVFGLQGIDRLICFTLVRDLTAFVKVYRRVMTKPVLEFVGKVADELHPTTQFPPGAASIYTHALNKTAKLWPLFTEFVSKIGQAQLLRRQIANELNFTAKLDSKLLACSIETMNESLINDIKVSSAL